MRLGIDIGGTKTHVVVVDQEGRVRAQERGVSGRGPAEVLRVSAELAHCAIATVGGPAGVSSVGACIPGLVDSGTGTVRHAVNLDIHELPIGAELGARLDMPVAVAGDVKAAALWVHRSRQPSPGTVLAYLNLGTGLAAAMIGPAGLVLGPAGAAGEIGHIPVAGGQDCPCGQTGCLETLASGAALERRWGRSGSAAGSPFAAARSGDRRAADAVEALCEGTAHAIQVLVLAAGAQEVVVGGGLANLSTELSQGVRDVLVRRAKGSPLLTTLALAERFTVVPASVPLAALGATLLSRP